MIYRSAKGGQSKMGREIVCGGELLLLLLLKREFCSEWDVSGSGGTCGERELPQKK